jgi:hypothetical protein
MVSVFWAMELLKAPLPLDLARGHQQCDITRGFLASADLQVPSFLASSIGMNAFFGPYKSSSPFL